MKKRMIRLTLPCLIMAMIFSCIQTLPAIEAPSQAVINAAEKGMTEFLSNPAVIGSKKSPIASFTGPTKPDMTLGAGVRIYTVEDGLPEPRVEHIDHEPGHCAGRVVFASVAGRLQISEDLFVNVVPAAMLTVAETNGEWHAVSIGGAGIARELYQVINRWPAGEGYNYRFIRIFQARSDFIEISRNGNVSGFVPLTSSRISFKMAGPFDPAVMMRNSEIFPQLKDIMSKHAQEPMLPAKK